MSASFHIIDKSTWERTIYFDYYYSQIKCKYNLNANIDITVSILRNTHCMPYGLIVILPRITIKPNSNEQNWI